MASTAISVTTMTFGITVGVGLLALGAYLGTGNNGWTNALFYSVVGLVGAPVTAYSWGSRRSKRRQMIAGVTLTAGLFTSMAILLETTHELSGLERAWTQVPWLVAAWILMWLGWLVAALIRLILFAPPRTRNRLSSRRGDRGV